jgi:hypothetical protein
MAGASQSTLVRAKTGDPVSRVLECRSIRSAAERNEQGLTRA